MRRRVLVSLAGAACMIACGLDTSGLGPPDVEGGPPPGGGGVDAASEASGTSGSSSGSGSASGSGSTSGSGSGGGSSSGSGGSSGGASEGGPPPAPCVSGWTLVVGEMGSAACPGGYADAYQGVSNPQAQPGACTCSCNITQQPTCTMGNIDWHYGGQAPQCPSASPFPANGSCTPFFSAVTLGNAQQVQPLPLSGGTCTGQAVGDPSKVQETSVHTCSVPDAAAASVCGGNAPSGFAACVIAPGDVPCPSGSPFSNRTVIADTQTLVCSACSSCSVGGTCENASLDIYSDGQCQNLLTVIPANGTCVSVQGGKAAAYWYQAQVQATCNASGTSASFQAGNPQTLCCR